MAVWSLIFFIIIPRMEYNSFYFEVLGWKMKRVGKEIKFIKGTLAASGMSFYEAIIGNQLDLVIKLQISVHSSDCKN